VRDWLFLFKFTGTLRCTGGMLGQDMGTRGELATVILGGGGWGVLQCAWCFVHFISISGCTWLWLGMVKPPPHPVRAVVSILLHLNKVSTGSVHLLSAERLSDVLLVLFMSSTYHRSIRAYVPIPHGDIRTVGNIILTPTNQSPFLNVSDADGRQTPDLWVPSRVIYRLRHWTTQTYHHLCCYYNTKFHDDLWNGLVVRGSFVLCNVIFGYFQFSDVTLTPIRSLPITHSMLLPSFKMIGLMVERWEAVL
jgi:hypothetical protein